MNKRRSLGIYAFRTPTSDHLNYGTKFRTLNNQGRTMEIASMMRIPETMAMSDGCSYDVEHYLDWSTKVYNRLISSRWEEDFWLDEEITFWNNPAWEKLQKHFNLLKSNYTLFREEFVPMKWTSHGVTIFDIRGYCEYLSGGYQRKGIKLRNVAMEVRPDGTTVLYGRKTWLATFLEGQQMINYYTMATKFHDVYGF